VTEAQLVKGCINENRTAQQEVFRLYAGKMLTVCRRYARHNSEAQDLLQEGFIRVFNKVHTFKSTGSFEGWIRRVMVNVALKNYQKSSYQKEQIGLEGYQEGAADPTVFSHLHEEELLKLVASLPEGYRVVFNLYAIEGYSHAEVAELMGIGESTSRSQLVKARKMLQGMVIKLQKVA
jgi:RNA polymerase sigma factor (sigma-70 family)